MGDLTGEMSPEINKSKETEGDNTASYVRNTIYLYFL